MLISSVHTRERLAKQISSNWLPFRSANSISYCCITDKSILEKAKKPLISAAHKAKAKEMC